MTTASRTTAEKIHLFRDLFRGRQDVYGTYDPTTGRGVQVKEPVTDAVLLDHLRGRKPFGVYLLVEDRTRAVVIDVDTDDRLLVLEIVDAAIGYGLPVYVERSKSKGWHLWALFGTWIPAHKPRRIMRHILEEVDAPTIEVFPKQDALSTDVRYGNFINAPLFGGLVPEGRTAFVDPRADFAPQRDQWLFLETVQRVDEDKLDEIIEINDLADDDRSRPQPPTDDDRTLPGNYGLPPCAQRMLQDGVSELQRVSCFRLAVHLRRLGFPFDAAIAVLKVWSLKNEPANGKRVITEKEIVEQAGWAYRKGYRGYGCEDPAVAPFCSAECPLSERKNSPSRRERIEAPRPRR